MISIFKKKEIDMTSGPIFKQLIVFMIPLLIANLLQMTFSLADTLVLGIFADNGDLCVGAVSTTASLIGMVTSLFIGLSIGANVVTASNIGSRNYEKVKRTIGTSIMLSIITGFILLTIGIFCSRTFLTWLNVSDVFIDLATRYITIYLCGAPFIMLYNFSANILRASGDNVRPMIYITIGGVINVILNVILVVFTPLDIEGVAIATVASNAFAGIACFIALLRNKSVVKFEWKHFRLYKKELGELIRVGIPSGINSCLFSFSNVLISSSINQLGNIYGQELVSGSGYANQFDNIIFVCMEATSVSCLAYVSQNMGARNCDRIKKAMLCALSIVSVVGITISAIMVLTVRPIIMAISGNELVAKAAFTKTLWIGSFYVLCGIMEVLNQSIRGMGKNLTCMIITFTGTIFFRIIWILFIFPLKKTEAMLYCVYPITWAITLVVLIFVVIHVFKGVSKKFKVQENFSNDKLKENKFSESVETA